MATVERLRVFPVKGLDGIDLDSARILDGGTLAHDRELALFDADGEVLNGKRTPRVHDLAVDFDPTAGQLFVDAPDDTSRVFDLSNGGERAEQWFGDFFDVDLTLRHDESLGFVDRRELGPSVISTGTVRTVASWFEGMTVESARRRLRANVEISGVPAFWEDRFVGDGSPDLEVGEVRLEGVKPCGRCVVPERDPDTGEAVPEFREQFVTKRRETFPEWADERAFDHFYSLMIVTDVPETDRSRSLRVGDSVSVLE